MRRGKGPRNYSTGKWNTRPQRGESLKGFFFSSISMSLPLQFENPPTQRLTTPAPRDRTALERVVRKPAPTSHFINHPTDGLYHHTSRNGDIENARADANLHLHHPTNTTNTTNSRCESAQKSHPPALSCRLPADKNAKLHSSPGSVRHLQPPPLIGFPPLHPIGGKRKGPFRARKIGRELASRYWPGCIFVNLQRRHPTWWGLRCAAPAHVVGGRMVPTENPIPLREGGWMDGEERS